jgi:LysM repeat protein
MIRKTTALIVLLSVLLGGLQPVFAQDGDTGFTYYVVQPGDNLFRLALRFNTTIGAIAALNGIVNPSLIYAGTTLKIPVGQGAATTTPDPTTPTPEPQPVTGIHVVKAGETLFRIALTYDTTVTYLAALNGLANPSLIYVGQQIKVPTEGGQVPVDTATPEPGTTPEPGVTSVAPSTGFAYGIQVHLPGQNMAGVVSNAQSLGVEWVKQQIEWKVYEPSRGNIEWATLDEMVNALNGGGFKILFSVAKAPAWARATLEENGPPADYADYANFVAALAERYKGKVQAYEIWNEQNLRREWNTGQPLSAASYVQLLSKAYVAIKAKDPSAIVVSGGLAPTGLDDGFNAINDRTYLSQMYAAGLKSVSDAVGAHPNGWANPPENVCCNPVPGVPTHNDHPSFYFRNTLEEYRAIMVANGDANTFIWATEFGWGTHEDLPGDPVAGFEFVSYTSLAEQAQYYVSGLQLGKNYAYVGPMFIWNLNFCQASGPQAEQCYFALIGPDGQPRPVYTAIQSLIP